MTKKIQLLYEEEDDFMENKLFTIVIIVVFAFVMWVITTVYKKLRGDKIVSKPPKPATPRKLSKEEASCQKYCNEHKNDNYKARVNWILDHDDNARKDRGQDNST